MTDSKAHETPHVGSNAPSPGPVHQAAILDFPVVGLIGSAGSRQALETFFRNVSHEAGIAFMVVTRLAARHINALRAAIIACTDMPVVTAADGAILQPDHVYIAPHGVYLTLEGGVLRLQHAARMSAANLLDTFLVSLATTQREKAVAIVLSGTGKDSVTGLRQMKAHNGLILVQDPDSAAHPALPRRAAATQIADLVAPIPALARHLVRARGDLADVNTATNAEQDPTLAELFTAILAQINTHTGRDLSHYKMSTLQRRIARRMQMRGFHNLAQYLEILRTNPEETVALFKDCLVSVTSFFRDPDAYTMLQEDCLPQIFAGKGRNDTVRVWIAGCATGEEAYSVAMQLTERAALMTDDPPRIQVFATDLDEEAIAVARRGIYPATAAKDIGPQRLQQFLVKADDHYQIKPEIREMVLFAVHDLLKDPPFSRLDLICCRNVLIYFNRDTQEKVFDIFHYALNPTGYLFLGSSESTDSAAELFAVLNKHCHLYQRREQISLPHRRLPSTALATLGGRATERDRARQAAKPRTIEEIYLLWTLRHYTPPRMLINKNYDITHLFGGADRYLQEREGAITQNVLQKVLPDLRLDLRAALYQAFNKSERTVSRLLGVEIDGEQHLIQLHVGPVLEAGFPKEYAEVVFVAREGTTFTDLSTDGLAESDLSLVERMEEELLRTRERLQTIIEDHEIANQELKTSNEELQSINEELKSTTEELETSKEELQSMNEELITVNGEMKQKIDELYRLNSDLLNLISSTDVGVVFLNDALQIKRFTPRALELFNLIESDIGRPFSHVTTRIRHTALTQLATHVRDTGERIEETVQSQEGHWYILRVLPYRTVSGKNDGLVLTFIDISDLKRAEAEERQRVQQQTLAALGREALETKDLAQLLASATQQVATVLGMEFCKVLELQPGDNTLLLTAGVGWHPEIVGQTTVLADTETQAGYTLLAKAPVVVRDLRTEPRFRPPALLSEHGVLSGISVVIPGIPGPYGVLSVHSQEPRSFAPYDVDFLQAVANTLAAAIIRRRAEVALRAQERRYRQIFESAGVSIWEEDFTEVKALIHDLKAQGIPDLRAHLTAHPAVVTEAAALVHIRDVNRQTLTLFGAKSKAELLTSLEHIFVPETMPIFREELITLAEGRSYYEAETTLQTLQGERFHALFTVTFPEPDTEPDRVLVTILDITARKQAEERLRFLAEASKILASSLDYTVTLQNMALTAVPGIADWCAIDLLQADGSIEAAAIAHVDPAKIQWAEELRQHYPVTLDAPNGVPAVIRTGQSEFYAEITDAMFEAAAKNAEELQLLRTIGYRSLMITPLQTHDRVLGAITFVSTQDGRFFDADDLAMAEELARNAAAAIANAQLHRAVQQREQQLSVSEERLRLATEASGIGIYDYDLQTHNATFSNIYRQIGGFTPNEKLTRPMWLARIHPDDRAMVDESLRRAVDHGESYDYEYRIYRPDGSLRWLEVHSQVTVDETGRATRLTGALNDVTARKQAEEEIRRLNRDLKRRLDELQTLLDVAPIGIFVAHDPLCEVITSNPAGAKMLGITPTANASKNHPDSALPFRVMRQGQEVPPHELPMQYATQHDAAVYNVELDIVYTDGGVTNLYEYAVPLHDEESKVRGCLGVFVDITARKQVEEALRDLTASLEQRVAERTAELERSNRELDEFAYVASHDLKAPLRAIVNLAGWIAEDAGAHLPTPSLEHLGKLRGRALRMERLLDDLLTYSRIGRRDGVVEEVKIDALIQDMIYLLAPPTGLQVGTLGEMPVLLTQRTPLEMIFRNLIGNAIKHHHQTARGVVQISAQDRGDFVEFVVSDNGPGIEPQYHERIFGMFQTLRPRDELESSGMGLAIVKRAVEYRNGTISVESIEGKGTTFRFTWPKKINTKTTE